MRKVISKVKEWVDKNEFPFRDGKIPIWGLSLIAVITFSTAIATVIGGIWLWLIILTILFLYSQYWLIKHRNDIKSHYIKIKYNHNFKNKRNDFIAIVGIGFVVILLQILAELGVLQVVGQFLNLVKNSFSDVLNVAKGLDIGINYNRSISILLLIGFGIFALQLARYLPPKVQDKKLLLLDRYVNGSHKYQWSYFLNWLMDKDWDLICGNSVRVVGRSFIAGSPDMLMNSWLRDSIQNEGRQNFSEFRNNLTLKTKNCRLGSFQDGKLELDVYSIELIDYLELNKNNKKMLESSLNHFICQEILGIESFCPNGNGFFNEFYDYEFLDRIECYYAADLSFKLPTSKNSEE